MSLSIIDKLASDVGMREGQPNRKATELCVDKSELINPNLFKDNMYSISVKV